MAQPRSQGFRMRTRRESPGLGQSRDMDILDSYSSRSGETFLTGNYKQVFETNKKLSIDGYYLCVASWHESAEISGDSVDVL